MAALESKSPKGAALSDSESLESYDSDDVPDFVEASDVDSSSESGEEEGSPEAEPAKKNSKKPAKKNKKKPAMMQAAPSLPSTAPSPGDDSDGSDEDSDGSDEDGHLAAVTSNANKFNTVSRYPIPPLPHRYPIRTYPIPAPPSLHRRAPATT